MANLKTGKSVDTNRLAEALKKAGIDPRSHISIGIIAHDYNFLQNQFLADDNDIIKDKYGIYANVILTPELTPVFCKIAPAYAGAFGGLYYPYHLLDTVLVVVPDGNLNNYPAIIGHYYTGTETLPSQIDLKNMWLVLEDGANANIITLGGDINVTQEKGNVNINVDSSHAVNIIAQKINLGSSGASHKAVLGDILENLFTKWVTTVFPAHTHSGVTSGSAATGNATPISSPLDGTELSNIVKVDS